jgi:hypothetical protein
MSETQEKRIIPKRSAKRDLKLIDDYPPEKKQRIDSESEEEEEEEEPKKPARPFFFMPTDINVPPDSLDKVSGVCKWFTCPPLYVLPLETPKHSELYLKNRKKTEPTKNTNYTEIHDDLNASQVATEKPLPVVGDLRALEVFLNGFFIFSLRICQTNFSIRFY